MAITSERLKQTFSEGGAQEIYQEVKATGNFLGFARRYIFDSDYRVARSALWGLTKATNEELSDLQVILNELIDNPDALHEARLSHVYLLSRTDGRADAHPRSDGDRLLQARRKGLAQKDFERTI